MKTIYTIMCLAALCMVTSCSEGGEYRLGGWHGDLPRFGNDKPYQVVNNERTGEFEAAMFANVRRPEKAYKGYRRALLQEGWSVDEETENETMWVLHCDKGEKSITVTVMKNGLVAQIFYTGED